MGNANTHTGKFCLGRASIAALVLAMPHAVAQETDTDTDKRRSLDTITVTAQKQEQSLLDVSVAVSAVGGEAIDTYEILDNKDLQYIVPSVSFSEAQTTRVRSVFIRGLGTAAVSDGVEASVGTFVDGVVMGRDFQAFNNFNDIERIEVLRGPQGTLFGKNTSAGLIHVVTKGPDDEFGGDVSLGYGSDNEIRLSGSVTGPVSDDVAYRLSAYYNERDPLYQNVVLDTGIHDHQEFGVRGKLSFEISESTDLLLTADYSKSDVVCCGSVPRSTIPGGVVETIFALNGVSTDIASESNGDSVANTETAVENENWGLSATFEHDFGSLNLVSISAYREGNFFAPNSGDQLPYTFIDDSFTASNTTQFSQEARLASDYDGAFNFIAGLYYFEQNVDTLLDVGAINFWSSPLLGAQPFPYDVTGTQLTGFQRASIANTVDFTNAAVFGQATFEVTEQLRLIGGLRYTHDEVDAFKTIPDNSSTAPFLYDPAIFGPTPPPNTVFLNLGGFTVPFVPVPNAIAPAAGTTIRPSTEEDDLSYRAAIEYDLTDDVMIYLSHAKGYKGPALDVSPTAFLLDGQDDQAIVGPEFIYNTELGLRSAFLGGAGLFNLTIFHSQAEDLQAGRLENFVLTIDNVGEIENIGVEAEFVVLPTDNLQLSGFVAYQDAEIKEFLGNPSIVGLRPQRTPEWSYSLQGQHTWPVPSLNGELITSIAYSWRDDERLSVDDPRDLVVQDAYGLLDASITLSKHDGRYAFSLWGRNLTDETYATTLRDGGGSSGAGELFVLHNLGRERHFGARLDVKF